MGNDHRKSEREFFKKSRQNPASVVVSKPTYNAADLLQRLSLLQRDAHRVKYDAISGDLQEFEDKLNKPDLSQSQLKNIAENIQNYETLVERFRVIKTENDHQKSSIFKKKTFIQCSR